MKSKVILRTLRPAAFAATGLVLLGVLLSAFASAAHGYLPNGAEVWCALGYVAVLGGLYALGSRLASFLQRYGAVLLGVAAAVYFVAQLCLASSLRFEPAFDMAAV